MAKAISTSSWASPAYGGQTWSITGAIQAFGGNKTAFIAAYANETGKSEATARRNVNRWLAGEHERNTGQKSGKQVRNISKAAQKEVNRVANKKAGGPAHIKLKGTIGINGKGKGYTRVRDISWSASWDDIYNLEDIAEEEGEDAAWEAFADLYEVESAYGEEDVSYTVA